jgi:hypothetical protein
MLQRARAALIFKLDIEVKTMSNQDFVLAAHCFDQFYSKLNSRLPGGLWWPILIAAKH